MYKDKTIKTDKVENVIIIGGGPAGLSAALYTARANLSPLVFAGSPPGGQLTLTTEVENFPGIESILGPELIEKMRHQVKRFEARILDQNITKVDFTGSPFSLSTVDKNYQAKTVIIATGAKALWLGLPSEQRLRGKGVSACATCDGFFFRNKVVGVVGGGDTALEEAGTLTRFASKVYIIHRRDSFRASKIMQERVLKDPKIETIWNCAVEEVVGENRVEGVKLRINQTSEVRSQKADISDSPESDIRPPTADSLKLDGLFIAIGHRPDTELFQGQINLDEKGYVCTTNYMTSVPGVFAAGDCVDHIYRQAGTAAGMGIAAALEVERYLEAI